MGNCASGETWVWGEGCVPYSPTTPFLKILQFTNLLLIAGVIGVYGILYVLVFGAPKGLKSLGDTRPTPSTSSDDAKKTT